MTIHALEGADKSSLADERALLGVRVIGALHAAACSGSEQCLSTLKALAEFFPRIPKSGTRAQAVRKIAVELGRNTRAKSAALVLIGLIDSIVKRDDCEGRDAGYGLATASRTAEVKKIANGPAQAPVLLGLVLYDFYAPISALAAPGGTFEDFLGAMSTAASIGLSLRPGRASWQEKVEPRVRRLIEAHIRKLQREGEGKANNLEIDELTNDVFEQLSKMPLPRGRSPFGVAMSAAVKAAVAKVNPGTMRKSTHRTHMAAVRAALSKSGVEVERLPADQVFALMGAHSALAAQRQAHTDTFPAGAMSIRGVARLLGIDEKTVRNHLRRAGFVGLPYVTPEAMLAIQRNLPRRRETTAHQT